MTVAPIHAIHRLHKDKSAHGNVDDPNENLSVTPNGHTVVVAENYTLLLKNASYFVDAVTRDRVLEARRLGGLNVSFQPAVGHETCACRCTVTISPSDVLGFIAHDQDNGDLAGSNVVPLRAAR